MHYIRFLKFPSAKALPKATYGYELTSKITITSDLGESFLCADLELVAVLVESDDRFSQKNHNIFSWKAGSRELDVSWLITTSARGPLSELKWPCRLQVYVLPKEVSPKCMLDVLEPVAVGDLFGSVLRVESEPFCDRPSGKPKRVKRTLQLDSEDQMEIWEETGESIARHIWDAGIVLSSYLYGLKNGFEKTQPKELSALKRILTKPKTRILELGAGCGIVGITLATCFEGAEVIMTDLPEAEEIAKFNISKNTLALRNQDRVMTLAYQNLDWATPDPVFATAHWDLIVAGDVTYNSDVVPHLVQTISDVSRQNAHAPVLLAMKVRHDSEAVFFDLMQEKKLYIVDQVVIPLPVVGEEDQEIEIYLFSRNASMK